MKKKAHPIIWLSRLGFLILFSILGFQCQRTGQDQDIVAKVNGQPIFKEEFQRELNSPLGGQDRSPSLPAVNSSQLKRKILDQIIQNQLLLQEAEKQGIQISQSELETHVAQIQKGYKGGEFKKMLKNLGYTETQWIELEKNRLRISKLYQHEVLEKVDISPEAIQSYYEAHKKNFSLPEQVRIRQIVVPTEAEAHNLRGEIRRKRGENFAELAKKHSLSPDSKEGGDVGFFSKGEMPEVFDQAFEMRVRKISTVIESEYGFHIFQLLEKKPPRVQTLEEVKSQIIALLSQGLEERLYRQWIQSLHSEAEITLNESLLEKI